MTGIILAGGKSLRMGQDKALLKFGERTLLEHLSDLTSRLFRETLIIVNEETKLNDLDLGGARIYEDLIEGQGPLAAIYTGLLYSKELASCVLTCDMPFVDEFLIHELVSFCEGGFDVVCLEGPEGNHQPFPGIYRRTSRFLIRSLLDRGENSMRQFFEIADIKAIVLPQEKIQVLTNMNHMEDYHQALKRMEQSDAFSSQ